MGCFVSIILCDADTGYYGLSSYSGVVQICIPGGKDFFSCISWKLECLPRTIWDARAEDKGNMTLMEMIWSEVRMEKKLYLTRTTTLIWNLKTDSNIFNRFGEMMSILFRRWKSFFFSPPPLQSPLIPDSSQRKGPTEFHSHPAYKHMLVKHICAYVACCGSHSVTWRPCK